MQQIKEGIPKHGVRKSRAGFTLTEVIVVITIIGIFAAIAIPSMIGFIEHGQQVNRMNIARTLYLAAQNQLTNSSVEKNLKSTMAGQYFKKDDNGFYTDFLVEAEIAENNVAQKLSSNFPSEEEDNKDYIHYISKPKGYVPTDEKNELNSFYNLLDESIIDKSILNDAILIEYNIKTGVVLSLFYGDAFEDGQTEFEYKDENNNDRNNVTGGRGMENGYQYASQRKQGYYGVDADYDTTSIYYETYDANESENIATPADYPEATEDVGYQQDEEPSNDGEGS